MVRLLIEHAVARLRRAYNLETYPPTRVSELRDLDYQQFERLVARNWQAQGYDVKLTSGGADGGVDVVAFGDDDTIAIQAKRFSESNKVSSPTIQRIAGAAQQIEADRAAVVTSSSFTEPAKETAAKLDVQLIDGRSVIDRVRRWD